MTNGEITIKKKDLWKITTVILAIAVIVLVVISLSNGSTGNAVNGGSASGDFQTLTLNYEDLVDDDAMLGLSTAPVTIVEFSDYECPFCGRHFTETYPSLKSNYIDSGDASLVFRDFPLSFHPMALPAAMAAECVGEEGGDEAYFEFHDMVFENQNTLSESNLVSWAQQMGYNISSCLDSGEFELDVQSDMSDGQAVGVTGTPGFIILTERSNADLQAYKDMYLEQSGRVLIQPVETKDGAYVGVRISGAFPYSAFSEAIDAGL